MTGQPQHNTAWRSIGREWSPQQRSCIKLKIIGPNPSCWSKWWNNRDEMSTSVPDLVVSSSWRVTESSSPYSLPMVSLNLIFVFIYHNKPIYIIIVQSPWKQRIVIPVLSPIPGRWVRGRNPGFGLFRAAGQRPCTCRVYNKAGLKRVPGQRKAGQGKRESPGSPWICH